MSLQKNETLTGWTLLQHICLHFWAWLLLYSAITPKSEDKYVVKVFNWSEFHLSKVTFLQNQYFNLKVKTLQSKYYKARKLVIFFFSSGSKWKEWLSHLLLLTAGMCHDCVWVKNTFHLHMKDRKASTKGQGDNTYV